MNFKAVVIGSSAGGMDALRELLSQLNEKFSLPIIIIQHLNPNGDSYLATYLSSFTKMKIKEAEDKDKIIDGYIYIAPPNYHLMIEKDKSLTLTVESKVNYSRPSIDVLFESAADAYEDKLVGIILTGANCDGSKGLKEIKVRGGLVIIQDPTTAQVDTMPISAMNEVKADYILSPTKIGQLLSKL